EEDTARLKDELVAVVSHELRTPIASMVGFTELLLNRTYTEQRQREFLSVMLVEGRRLTGLINDFLDLQRMDNDSWQLTPTLIDPTSTIALAVTAAGEDPERPIVVDLPSGLPLINADAARFQQVLGNLLGNARKYSPAGGEGRVS